MPWTFPESKKRSTSRTLPDISRLPMRSNLYPPGDSAGNIIHEMAMAIYRQSPENQFEDEEEWLGIKE
jgi:hypothetical protein